MLQLCSCSCAVAAVQLQLCPNIFSLIHYFLPGCHHSQAWCHHSTASMVSWSPIRLWPLPSRLSSFPNMVSPSTIRLWRLSRLSPFPSRLSPYTKDCLHWSLDFLWATIKVSSKFMRNWLYSTNNYLITFGSSSSYCIDTNLSSSSLSFTTPTPK